MNNLSFDKKPIDPIEQEFHDLAHRLQASTQRVKGVMLGVRDLGGSSAVDEQTVIDFCKFWREKQVGKEYPKYPSDIDFKNWYHRQQDRNKGDLCPYEICHGDGYIAVVQSNELFGVSTLAKVCRCVTSESKWEENKRIWNINKNPFHMSHELASWKKRGPQFYMKTKKEGSQFMKQERVYERVGAAFQND